MMQTTRSGLAAAAAKRQLTETPEGKSSLQIRLDEAERRAHEAEATAQDAQATLARTLLEAARVEAVVMARMKAESEAEIVALRSQLGAAKRLSATHDTALSALNGSPATEAGEPEAAPVPEPPSYRPIVLTEWDRPLEDIGETADGDEAAPRPGRDVGRRSPAFAFGSIHMALPAIAAIFILLGYDFAGYLMSERSATPVAPAQASRTTEEASGANWLLYMPVERTAVAQYLGGNVRSKRQLAVTSTPATKQRN